MIDVYGKWTAEKDYGYYPEKKWCNLDYVAAWIKSLGYEPKTTIENLAEMIVVSYDSYLTDNEVEFYSDIDADNLTEKEIRLLELFRNTILFMRDTPIKFLKCEKFFLTRK